MARPSKLNPDVQDKIVQAITGGNDNVVAAAYAGIHEATFYRWMADGGEAKSGQLCEFRKAVEKAQADAEVRYVAIVETVAAKSWQAAAWWLERKHNDRWGRKERQEHVGKDGGPIEQVIDHSDSARERLRVKLNTLAARFAEYNDSKDGDDYPTPATT